MATTTNYGWTTPDNTALVKDGAAAIRSLGTAIDTTVFNNASAAIAKSIVDAKGDIIAATAADTVARLAVGSNGQYLQADSSTATGLKWASVATGLTYVGCAIYQNTNLTVSNNTATALDFQAEQYDTDGFHSTVSNTTRMTIPSGKAGKYQITSMINVTNNFANYAFLMIYLNGSAISANGVDGGKFALTKAADDFLQGSVTYDFAVNDYIEIYLLHNSGGDRTVSAARCSLDYLGA